MLKKNTVTLLVVFAVLLAVVVVLQNNRDTRPPEVALTPPPTPLPFLFSFGTETVSGIRVSNLDGAVAHFEFGDEGLWIGLEPPAPAIDVDQTGLPGLAAGLSNLRVISALGSDINADDIGLDPAPYRAVLTLSDGSTRTLAVGSPSPIGNGYFVLAEGDSTPKLVSMPTIDQLIGLIDNPPIIPTPTATATITATVGITGTVTVTPTLSVEATDQP
jgi:hypothetical protein